MTKPDAKKVADKIIEASKKFDVINEDLLRDAIQRALLAFHAAMLIGDEGL